MKSNLETSNRFRLEEIGIIDNLKTTDYQSIKVTSELFQIEFDNVEPKIRLSSLQMRYDSIESRSILVQELCRIANESGFFGQSSGSHICVGLSCHENLNGYIRVSGDQYYQIHPDPDRFLENFSNHTTYFIQT